MPKLEVIIRKLAIMSSSTPDPPALQRESSERDSLPNLSSPLPPPETDLKGEDPAQDSLDFSEGVQAGLTPHRAFNLGEEGTATHQQPEGHLNLENRQLEEFSDESLPQVPEGSFS